MGDLHSLRTGSLPALQRWPIRLSVFQQFQIHRLFTKTLQFRPMGDNASRVGSRRANTQPDETAHPTPTGSGLCRRTI